MLVQRLNQTLSRVPLRWVLTVPFVLLTVGASGLVGYFSYRSGQTAVQELANQLLEQVSQRVSEHLDNFLKTPQQVVAMNRFTAERGDRNLTDFDLWQRYFQQQIGQSDYLTTVTVVTAQGEVLGVGKDRNALFAEKNDFIVGELKTADRLQRRFYLLNQQGDRVKLIRTLPTQDIRLRPWARQIETAKQPFWTAIFSSAVVSSASIGAITPVIQDDVFQGYFSSEFFLVDINNFLHSLNFSPSGQVFILERTGDLVSNSTLEQPFVKSERQRTPVRLRASQSQDLLTRLATEQILNQWHDLNQIQQNQQLRFTHNHQIFFTRIIPYRDSYGLDWLIVAIVPESDFMTEIQANLHRTLLLSLFTLLIAIGLGVLITRSIAVPISRLNQAAKAIALGNLHQSVNANSVREVTQLSQSFQQMTTQLSQLLQASQDSERKFSTLLDSVPVGVSVFDASGKIVLVNRAGQIILGQGTADHLPLDKISETYRVYVAKTAQLYPTEQLPAVRALQGETTIVDDVEIEVNGRRVPLEIHTIPVFDAEGKVLYAINAFQDITERRQAEQLQLNYNRDLECQVAEQTAALQEINRMKDEFISIVTHELRTPLTAIRASLGLLDAGMLEDEPDTRERMLHVAAQSSDRLVRLVNDILNLERLESGKVQLVIQACDLSSLIEQAIDAVESIAIGASVTLSTSAIEAQVWASSDAIVQTLINLISNAIRFSAAGDRVWIKAEFIESMQPALIRFAVQDQGRGIPADKLESIFGRFQQVDSSDSREKGGTGLGLAICKSIVQQHGGQIWVESKLNQGSTFYFTLPLAT